MKTAYYTFYTREDAASVARASGEDRLVRFTRQPQPKALPRREDNVISLGEYRARLAAERWEEPEADFTDGEEDFLPEEPAEEYVPRSRTDHGRNRPGWLELAACAAMICVALAACAAFLL